MKLEFLDKISDGEIYTGIDSEQLIRLFDFDKLQANKLRHCIQKELIENGKSLVLGELDFIETVNCSLVLHISDADTGITKNGSNSFACDLSVAGYENMVTLIEPFCHKTSRGYQWLYDIDTPIEFLFSSGGSY